MPEQLPFSHPLLASHLTGAEHSNNVGDWINYLHQYCNFLWGRVQALETQEKKNMATADKIQADLTQYTTDVMAALATLQKSVTDLKNQLAANPIPADVQAKLDAVDADLLAADAAVKAAPASAPAKKK